MLGKVSFESLFRLFLSSKFLLALKFVSPDVNPPIPWHRVLSSSGTISSRGPGTDGASRQRNTLLAEGVDVITTRSGDFKVDLREYGWFPAVGTIDTGEEMEGEDVPENNDGTGGDESDDGEQASTS